jgi:hypothetical protein
MMVERYVHDAAERQCALVGGAPVGNALTPVRAAIGSEAVGVSVGAFSWRWYWSTSEGATALA